MLRRFLVQDAASKGFLTCSLDGDITVTPWVKSAYPFDNLEAAVLTALHECDQGYQVFTFFIEDKEI